MDFIYDSSKTAVGNILLFLDSESLGRIHQTSEPVDIRLKMVRLHMWCYSKRTNSDSRQWQTDMLEAADTQSKLYVYANKSSSSAHFAPLIFANGYSVKLLASGNI